MAPRRGPADAVLAVPEASGGCRDIVGDVVDVGDDARQQGEGGVMLVAQGLDVGGGEAVAGLGLHLERVGQASPIWPRRCTRSSA